MGFWWRLLERRILLVQDLYFVILLMVLSAELLSDLQAICRQYQNEYRSDGWDWYRLVSLCSVPSPDAVPSDFRRQARFSIGNCVSIVFIGGTE